MPSGGQNKLTIEVVKTRLKEKHGDIVTIVDSTYRGMNEKAIFVDRDFGEWPAKPGDVIWKGSGHPLKWLEKSKNTSLRKFGVDNPSKSEKIKAKKRATTFKNFGVESPSHSRVIREKAKKTHLERHGSLFPYQSPEIALKAARKVNNPTFKIHWKTGEELLCQGGYESKVVDYLNTNKINFDWQPKTFMMSNGKTYRPDFYLSDKNVWVEIKGWMRKDAQEKWDWLKAEFPTAELWNQKKLKEIGIL